MADTIGRYVGIGVRHYPGSEATRAPHATCDVRTVRELLGDAFNSGPLCNPTDGAARALPEALASSRPDGGALTSLWSGHGRRTTGLRLVCSGTASSPCRGLDAAELVHSCAISGTGQILLIIDTCYSGEAIATATDIAAPLLETYPRNAPGWSNPGRLLARGHRGRQSRRAHNAKLSDR